jgi:hypothetical protein
VSRAAAIDSSLARITGVRLDGISPAIERRSGPGEGWFAVEELLTSDSAPADLLGRIRGMHEVPADHIRAEWLFESYARAVADLGVSFLVAERRLPRLQRDNLLMASAGGLIAGIAVIAEDLNVVATDPVEDGPAITRYDTWPDLVREFREAFTGLLGPMIDWMVSHRLRQEKTLWSAAADRLAQSLLWSGRAFEARDFAAGLAHELLNQPGPMKIPLDCAVDARGNEHHLRTTCCLAYRAAGGGLCFGCPLNR